jgi:hypothetical protein
MDTKNKQYPILPYDLRVEIWELINQKITTSEIIERLYSRAPAGVSEGQFKSCIRAIKAIHTVGQRPSKNR